MGISTDAILAYGYNLGGGDEEWDVREVDEYGGLIPDTGGMCSPWAVIGQYHWQLANVRPLAEPVPCKGALKLWCLPGDVEKLVRAQLGEDGNQ